MGLIGFFCLRAIRGWAVAEGDPKMGQVAMEQNADGRLEVFRVSSDGELQHRWQKQPSGEWSPWWGLGGKVLPGLAVARRADDCLEVFAVDRASNSLACIRQTTPNGPVWGSWVHLDGRVRAPVAVGQNLDGRLEVFAVEQGSGVVRCLWETNRSGDWSGWSSVGGQVEPGLAVGRNKDGRLALFGVERGGQRLLYCVQTLANEPGNWNAWGDLGGVILPRPVVGRNPDGRLEVFAVNALSNAVDHIYQLSNTNAVLWSSWSSLGGSVKPGIAIGENADGHLEVIAMDRNVAQISHCWQMQPGNSADWAAFCGMAGWFEPYPAVGLNQDGSLIIVGRDLYHPAQFDYKRQISANIDWLDCFSMDHPTFPYTARIWQTADGLPHTTVQAIAQTRDGYLWVGTRKGLARFDGVRFTCFSSENTPELPNASITALCADRNGALWIGTEGGGAACLKDGVFTHYSRSNGLAGDHLMVIYEDRNGSLWFGTTAGMSQYAGGKFTTFGRQDGLLSEVVRSIFDDGRNELWIGTAGGLNLLQGGVMRGYCKTNGLPDDSIRGLTRDKGGRLWVGSDNGMIWHNDAGQFYAYDSRYGLSDRVVNAICEDREGNLWVGTDTGLYRFREGRFFNENNSEGASYDKVNTIFEDRDGNLWVGSREGLIRLTPKRFETFDTRQGLTYNNTASVLEDRAGGLWIGTLGGGLNHLGKDGITAYTEHEGLPHNSVLALCEGREDELWIGTGLDGALSRLKNRKIVPCTPGDGWARGSIRALCEDRSGRLWVGTSQGLSCLQSNHPTLFPGQESFAGKEVRAICEDQAGRLWFGTAQGLSLLNQDYFTTFTTRDGLLDNAICALYEDKQQNLWIGTANGGLSRWKAGHIKTYSTRQGLFSNEVLEILEDNDGWLWMSCSQGIFRVRKSALDALDEGRSETVACIAYGMADGMETVLCNGLAKPAACKTQEGKLWFTTTKGLVVVDPSSVKITQTPPPVYIEQVTADRRALLRATPRSLTASDALTVPPGRGALEFQFTCLAFQKPEENRFRYMLEGADRDWVEGDVRRQARYLNLRPGTYRFRVMACNSDGVWNTTGAAIVVKLLPHFWQTWWFGGLTGLALVAGISWTARSLTRRRMQHRYELMERERAIEQERARIAKDIHDDLGSSLTRIMMLGDRVQKHLAHHPEADVNVQKIVTSARSTVRSLDEIVWAVNPENDTLNSLIAYIGQYVDQFFEGTSIRCRRELPLESYTNVLTAEVRHNLFLVIKEALNNILKHAGASEVHVRMTVTPPRLVVTIEDDGCGFDVPARLQGDCGNGLKNMRHRVEMLGGQLSFESRPGAGTRLTLVVDLLLKL